MLGYTTNMVNFGGAFWLPLLFLYLYHLLHWHTYENNSCLIIFTAAVTSWTTQADVNNPSMGVLTSVMSATGITPIWIYFSNHT